MSKIISHSILISVGLLLFRLIRQKVMLINLVSIMADL